MAAVACSRLSTPDRSSTGAAQVDLLPGTIQERRLVGCLVVSRTLDQCCRQPELLDREWLTDRLDAGATVRDIAVEAGT